MDEDNHAECRERQNEVQKFEDENKELDKVSQFRIIASQLVVLFPILLMKIRFGLGMGFTIILIPELFKKNSEIDLTLDTLTWFSSYCFVVPIAAACGGFIAQYIGVQRLLLLSYLFYIAADLIFYWANNAAMILVAQGIVGITNGIIKGPTYAYIAEILHPKFRSIAMAVTNLTAIIGVFLSTLLGNFLYWRTQALVILIFPAIGCAFIPLVPNSPRWLASKNRFKEAEKSFARLRGWTTPEAVKAELYSTILSSSGSNSLTPMDTAQESDVNPRKQTNLKKALAPYLHRSFYIPLLTVICVFFIGNFDGAHTLSLFSVFIFKEIKSPIDGHVGSVIMSLSSLVGSSAYIFVVPFLGKRIVALASLFIVAASFIVAVIFLYLMDDNQQEFQVYSWIVSIALITVTFAETCGIGKIMFFLSGELFPQKLRYIGSGIAFFICEVMAAVIGKIFLYIVLAITFPNTLILFAIINIIGFIIIYFILPETEGVTLQEIEAHYSGTQNLKNKR